jgi:hypothetical protein
MKTQNKFLISLMGLAVLTQTACEKTDRSFSLLDSGSTFQQAASYQTRKIDVLWVIDNSGSMQSSQDNLTANFASFINEFQKKGYDFHMAVTGTDAWRAKYMNTGTATGLANATILSRARTGRINFATSPYSQATDSGVNIIDSLTPNLSQVFVTNATQGINGTGDERAFSSMKVFLDYSANSDFRRPDAFLAVIIISDEDDFSGNTSYPIFSDYNTDEGGPSNDPNLHPMVLTAPTPDDPTDTYYLYKDARLDTVQSYKDYLNGLYGSTDNYSVNMIGVLDTACRTTLNNQVGGRRLGRRYAQLADMTNGVKTSLCGNFGDSLQLIAQSTLKLTAKFKLTREPDPASISITVDGVTVPQNASSGWTYDPTDWSITFNGDSVPPQGSNVQIFFTPLRADN